MLAALGLPGREAFNPTLASISRQVSEMPIEPAMFTVAISPDTILGERGAIQSGSDEASPSLRLPSLCEGESASGGCEPAMRGGSDEAAPSQHEASSLMPKAEPIEPETESSVPTPTACLESNEAADRHPSLITSEPPNDPQACEPQHAEPAAMTVPDRGARPGQGDPESRETTEEFCPTERTTAPTLDSDVAAPRLGPAPFSEADATEPAREDAHHAARTRPKKVSADELLRAAGVRRAFRASDGRYYVTVSVDGRSACYPLGSDDLDRLLVRRHHELTSRGPSRAFLANLTATLRARAEVTDDSEPVFVRVANRSSGDDCVIDLGDSSRRAVVITARGWELVDDAGVNFRRPGGMRALPEPARGGTIGELGQFVVIEPADTPLLIAWLTAALRPAGPYPVLVLNGQEGSAKTTAALVCRRLIDPHATLLRSFPKNERDLLIAAHHNWVPGFDNLSSLAPWQSDALCRLATGGGFGARQWFTNDHEVVIHAQRPITLGGINEFVERGDLADRCFFLHLPPIAPTRRLGEKEFWSRFHEAYPRLLGALYDAVAGGIGFWPEVRLLELSRMADVDRWGERLECHRASIRKLGEPAELTGSRIGPWRCMGNRFLAKFLETVVDCRDSRSTTGESRKMTDFHRIRTHEVQEFRYESHGDCQSHKGIRSGRDAAPRNVRGHGQVQRRVDQCGNHGRRWGTDAKFSRHPCSVLRLKSHGHRRAIR